MSVGRITGVMGANVTIHLSEAPVRLPYTIHCTQIGRVLKTPLFQLIVVMKEWNDGGGGGGGRGGGGAHHQGALVYILVLKLHVSKIPTQYCVYTHGSHVSECSLYKLYSGPVFPDRLSNNIHCHVCKASHLSTSSLHKK